MYIVFPPLSFCPTLVFILIVANLGGESPPVVVIGYEHDPDRLSRIIVGHAIHVKSSFLFNSSSVQMLNNCW